MDWTKVSSIIGKAAPLIGTLVGGPAGTAVGALVASALNTENTPGAIEQALTTDPEAFAKLAELEKSNNLELRRLALAHIETDLKIAAEDRANARKSAVDSGTSHHIFALSIGLLSLSLGSEVAVLFVGYPPHIPDIVVGRVLGLMDAIALAVMAYHYGTTANSQRKTELLAQSAPVTTR